MGDIFRNIFGYLLLAIIILVLLILCPIVIIGIVLFLLIAAAGYLLLGFLALFGIHFKDDDGKIINTWGDHPLLAGAIFLCIPAVLFGLFVALWNFLWVYEWLKWAFTSGEPFLIFLGVCVLAGGILLLLSAIGSIKRDLDD